MKNLNAEQIKKALECCTIWCGCDDCPFDPKGDCYKGSMECGNDLMKNALALINSQEQRIKELTEENERLMRDKTALECIVSTARNQAKAATVRKMQERLKALIKSDYINGTREQAMSAIDQIANELLNGEGMCHEK
jgi:hypothetical protein